jgi:hypothetical protein
LKVTTVEFSNEVCSTSTRDEFANFIVTPRRLPKYHIKKVIESRNRPGVVQRVPGGLGSQILKILDILRW